MVTHATGMKLWDRRDSGFKWNGNKPSIGSGECQPKNKVGPPLGLLQPQEPRLRDCIPCSPGSYCPKENSKQFLQQGRRNWGGVGG